MNKVLIGCEQSQVITKEFRKAGIECYSCDIEPCYGGHPEWHIQDDILNVISEDFILMIAHPPCTYLSNAGARHLFSKGNLNRERYKLGLQAKEFFIKLLNSDIKYLCIENPCPSSIFKMPNASQIIEPYMFGEPYSKRTYLWLKNLPKLKPTKIIKHYNHFDKLNKFNELNGTIYENAKYEDKRRILRSKTFEGIAQAMVSQWKKFVL